MTFRGKITLHRQPVAHHVEGDLRLSTLKDGKQAYKGHFSTAEQVEFTRDDIYRLEASDGRRTKIKVLALLSDLAGIKVFSFYATHPLA